MAVRQSSPEPAAIVPPRAIAYEGRRGRNGQRRGSDGDERPRASFTILRIGRNGWSNGTRASQLTWLNSASVFASPPRIRCPTSRHAAQGLPDLGHNLAVFSATW
jgi:hypothetical protein